jgi:hypothetical protein
LHFGVAPERPANPADVAYGRPGISAVYTSGVGQTVVEPPRTYGVAIRKAIGAD